MTANAHSQRQPDKTGRSAPALAASGEQHHGANHRAPQDDDRRVEAPVGDADEEVGQAPDHRHGREQHSSATRHLISLSGPPDATANRSGYGAAAGAHAHDHEG